MARRSIFASVALTILLVATAPQLAIASARATHKQFCAKARGEFYGRDIHVGDTVQVNMGAFNCSTQREHVPTTWRIWGPCHPDLHGDAVFVLHQAEGVVTTFPFRPQCAGRYHLVVQVFHRANLVDAARRSLPVASG